MGATGCGTSGRAKTLLVVPDRWHPTTVHTHGWSSATSKEVVHRCCFLLSLTRCATRSREVTQSRTKQLSTQLLNAPSDWHATVPTRGRRKPWAVQRRFTTWCQRSLMGRLPSSLARCAERLWRIKRQMSNYNLLLVASRDCRKTFRRQAAWPSANLGKPPMSRPTTRSSKERKKTHKDQNTQSGKKFYSFFINAGTCITIIAQRILWRIVLRKFLATRLKIPTPKKSHIVEINVTIKSRKNYQSVIFYYVWIC